MKKKILIVFCLCLLSIEKNEAEEFKYIRKSISGPNTVWINPESIAYITDSTQEFLEKTLKKNIETQRFDVNKLPNYVFQPIFNELNSNKEHDELKITELVDTYAVPEIENILNNPFIQEKRINAQKKDIPNITFADTKGKSQNVLMKDLEIFFNSAFIYFPFIQKIQIIQKENSIETRIWGGIIWYQIRDDGKGHKHVMRLKTIDTFGKDEIPLSDKDNRQDKQEQSLNFAIIRWCEELSIATKRLDAFQLSGHILEATGWTYTIDLGETEGVNLNDAYTIYAYEDNYGTELLQPVGFGIITSIKEPYAILNQQIGKKQTIGSYVKEYPRLTTHAQFYLGHRSNMNIKASDVEELKTDIKNGLMASFRLSQNLAESTKISQFFVGIETDFTLLENALANNHSGTPYLLSFSMFLEKKFWYHNNALFFNSAIGHERFYLKGSSPAKTYDITLESTHLGIGLGYERLLKPNVSFTLSIEQRITPGIQNGSIKYNNINQSQNYTFESDFKDTKFGGTLIRFGLNYILPTTYKLR